MIPANLNCTPKWVNRIFARHEIEAVMTQEDRDECGVVTEDPTGQPPMFCTKPHGHDGAHNTDGAA